MTAYLPIFGYDPAIPAWLYVAAHDPAGSEPRVPGNDWTAAHTVGAVR